MYGSSIFRSATKNTSGQGRPLSAEQANPSVVSSSQDAEAATALTHCREGHITNEELALMGREHLEVGHSKPGA
jgi:hypothetical protein